jgi:hypothetical protein
MQNCYSLVIDEINRIEQDFNGALTIVYAIHPVLSFKLVDFPMTILIQEVKQV